MRLQVMQYLETIHIGKVEIKDEHFHWQTGPGYLKRFLRWLYAVTIIRSPCKQSIQTFLSMFIKNDFMSSKVQHGNTKLRDTGIIF